MLDGYPTCIDFLARQRLQAKSQEEIGPTIPEICFDTKYGELRSASADADIMVLSRAQRGAFFEGICPNLSQAA
ncbi:hypothetical protein MPL3356_310006 [Mesorhizobium plurifarium]|uniref:Uncharacterized protein n=1 Tax=Mesorhizobium plurifarium TaxID=69974 RepID=A0A090GAJ2_MESPL|nr:hypothetical protein MPL3356_310006 [Mesorhizobium plurifarium]CDX60927.1 hypothetical protein MPL3365_50032 [Mesorhizobium plurifarium]